MRATVIDCYIDEPGSLGVPPFIHPGVRAVYGALVDAGCDTSYVTIDDIRQGMHLDNADVYVVMAGCAVPGRYIRAMPASAKEVLSLARTLPGIKVLGGPAALEKMDWSSAFDVIGKKDAASASFDLVRKGWGTDRWRTVSEWERWLLKGAECVMQHPDHPQPLIAEIETYRGCVRYRSGGCSFCIEPLKGEPEFRDAGSIIEEVARLHELGVRNFRLGAQTCFISYKAHMDGTDRPRPNPQEVERLLSGISSVRPDVLHLDNANPAIIAQWPDEARMVLESIAEHCTSGNVLALGLESADPVVREANNLNASAEETMQAVRMINEVGGERGPNGLPKVLPGINFIVGLDGERKESLLHNMRFLKGVMSEGLLLRRINIRQVIGIRRQFRQNLTHGEFLKFKEWVRQEVDHVMLERMLPRGTLLKGIYTELKEGKVTFGRQIGTYPILVGFEHPVEMSRLYDAKVTGWGFRSITAVEWPLSINRCHISAIEALPGVGRKRAMRVFRARPFKGPEDFVASFDDVELGRYLLDYVTFDRL
ncbi:MAG: radical SAM protein [Methanomassiliicoccales archaeon]|nr:MAG: radical SAM protein [Methanomassiliicoccales archaeon]